MRSLKVILFSLLVVVVLFSIIGCKKKQIDDQTKIDVQNAMNLFITEKLESNDGNYAINDINSEFDYLHDSVEQKEENYISCADFKAGDDVYNIDYFVQKIDNEYTVIKEVLHKKNGEEVNQILWEKE